MTIAGLNGVEGTGYYFGPWGKHDIEEAQKLESCAYAVRHWRAPVSERCCTVMEKKVKNPACSLFSQTAYDAGVSCSDYSKTLRHCRSPCWIQVWSFHSEDSPLSGISSISLC
ncbi:hypothetical protein F3Y22_tig00110013pilonHSYRG00291 [Hibiscus syriacus]|uniref:Uncharacterized protein n=1 Tax=Hibiscus syriacus TaxID=106335 RepID=A0A6A3BUB5_HIBSY|nr:hypothetical protein F3Y22_tig00110013pilonHSYRG00291 [Hibiscus syriacus]